MAEAKTKPSAPAYTSHARCSPVVLWSDKMPPGSKSASIPRKVGCACFDNLHQELVLFSEETPEVCYVSDTLNGSNEFYSLPIQLPQFVLQQGAILAANISPDRSLMAILIHNREVKLICTKTGAVTTSRSCRGRSAHMKAVYWLTGSTVPNMNYVLFVTSNGVELYSFLYPSITPNTRAKLKHVKTAPYTVAHHWFMPESNILLLVDEKDIFQAYKLNTRNIIKLCKFELECRGTSFDKNNQQFEGRQISLWNIYGKMKCVFVNEKKGQLHLLGLSNEGMEQTHVFDLYLPGRYEVSVVDEVLVMHNVQAKVSMLFDVRTDNKSALAGPLPIGFIPTMKVLKDGTMQTLRPEGLEANILVEKGWTTKRLSPRYMLHMKQDKSAGCLWRLNLDFQQIARSWPASQQTKLVDFLLKRSTLDSKQLIFQILSTLCVQRSSLHLLSRLFRMLNSIQFQAKVEQAKLKKKNSTSSGSARMSERSSSRAGSSRSNSGLPRTISGPMGNGIPRTISGPMGKGIPRTTSGALSPRRAGSTSMTSPRGSVQLRAGLEGDTKDHGGQPEWNVVVERNSQGYMILSQWDIYSHVFIPASQREKVRTGALTASVTEYMLAIFQHYMTAADYLHGLLVTLLVQDERHYEFHQYLQYHIINDSVFTANTLLDLSEKYPPAYQLALDMYYRLNMSTQLLVTLKNKGHLIGALRIVNGPRSALFEQKDLTPRDFLAAAAKQADPIFYWVYKFFQQRNQELRNSPEFIEADGCDDFVQAYLDRFVNQRARRSSMDLLDLPPIPSDSTGTAHTTTTADTAEKVDETPAPPEIKISPADEEEQLSEEDEDVGEGLGLIRADTQQQEASMKLNDELVQSLQDEQSVLQDF